MSRKNKKRNYCDIGIINGKKRGNFFLKKKYKNLINRRKFFIFGGNNKKFEKLMGKKRIKWREIDRVKEK